MRGKGRVALGVMIGVSILVLGLCIPPFAWAKVFFYALNLDGTLIKYDPDLDQIISQRQVGQGYLQPEFEDYPDEQRMRILDMVRQRLLVVDPNHSDQIAVLNLTTAVATSVRYDPLGQGGEFRQFIYPRQASRFYVHWLRKGSKSSRDAFVTAATLDGQVLSTISPPFNELQWPVYHPDKRNFYVFDGQDLTKLRLIEGETLSILTTYDLSPYVRPGYSGPGLNDVRDGRALLATGPIGIGAYWTVFTTDLTFAPASASARIATGIEAQTAFIIPGGQTILVQEARKPLQAYGTANLHFYDVASGAKVGSLNLAAPEGAAILGFHPDGRRLFVLTRGADLDSMTLSRRLVIVDTVARKVLRDRPFPTIGIAHDFVDEP